MSEISVDVSGNKTHVGTPTFSLFNKEHPITTLGN